MNDDFPDSKVLQSLVWWWVYSTFSKRLTDWLDDQIKEKLNNFIFNYEVSNITLRKQSEQILGQLALEELTA